MNIWVVSGCSSGLGRCWTNSIIKDRGDVVIGITRSEIIAEEMKQIYGDRFIPCICDVRDSEKLSELLLKLVDKVGRPSRVVTAAGYAQFGTLEELSNLKIREQFETNVVGTLNVIRPLLPILRKNDASRILLVSSMSGVACWPLLGSYQMSKYAIEAMSETLRRELNGTTIQIGCIEPGPHKTGWATKYAVREPIGQAYDSKALMAQASCGYKIEEPEASLPFFWKMFDRPRMPRRIATCKDFVNYAVKETQQRIEEWIEGVND